MTLMGGLALTAPYLQLPTPLPELTTDGFADGDCLTQIDGEWARTGNRYVWVNGQPLRGVRWIHTIDSLLFLPKSLGYSRDGPYVTILTFSGPKSGPAFTDFYHVLATYYYEQVDVRHYEPYWCTSESRNRFRSSLTQQTMTILDVDEERMWREGGEISIRFTSKLPYHHWSWWSAEVPPPGYKTLTRYPDDASDSNHLLLHV